MSATVWRGDEAYLSLETVAEIYRVRALWLREVAERGLLGPLESGDDGPLSPACSSIAWRRSCASPCTWGWTCPSSRTSSISVGPRRGQERPASIARSCGESVRASDA